MFSPFEEVGKKIKQLNKQVGLKYTSLNMTKRTLVTRPILAGLRNNTKLVRFFRGKSRKATILCFLFTIREGEERKRFEQMRPVAC